MSAQTNGFSTNQSENAKFVEVKIPVPWGHISGKWWGSSTKQPVIAIHGWQDNAGTFDNLAPLLLEKGVSSLLCIDLPGHGLSSHLPQGQFYYVFWDGIHILRRIVHHFKWKNISVMGHSLGGAIGFLYAAVYPEEITSIVQIDIASPSVHSVKRSLAVQGKAVDAFLKYDSFTADKVPRYTYQEILDLLVDAHKGSLTSESCEIMMRRGMLKDEKNPDLYILTRDPRVKVSALGNFSKEQVLAYAAKVKCKVLNIRAKPGHQFELPELYDQVLDTMATNAEVEKCVFDGTHHLHMNDAPRIAPTVANFLKQ